MKNNKYIYLIIVLILIIISYGTFIYLQQNKTTAAVPFDNIQNSQQAEIVSLKKKIQTLQEKTNIAKTPITKSVADEAIDFNLQTKCADKAHAVYVDLRSEDDTVVSFINHFNKKLNSCFVVIEWLRGSSHVEELSDAVTRQEYGSWTWDIISGKTSIINCTNSYKPSACSGDNSISWNDLKNPYMEN